MENRNSSENVALLELPQEQGMSDEPVAVAGTVSSDAEMMLRYGNKFYSPRIMAIYLLRLVFLGENLNTMVNFFSQAASFFRALCS